ncbi:type II toxin-antitoxin system VapC family toxin [Aquipuribacter nitratireducens]|uniref:Type II toxin-antitoxin system VapC family toxin n=1 Tax=Aquipuribacter nitratireducens TaxID=650104 RepID=A0ABW0GR24_9MICO
MIVDTSAVVAVLRDEPDAARYVEAMLDDRLLMAAPTWV